MSAYLNEIFYEALVRLQIRAEIRQTFLNLLTDVKAHTSDPKVMDLIDTIRTSLDHVEKKLAGEEQKRFKGYGDMPPS